MKIIRIETFAGEFVCFVKVCAEDGAIGWGQTAPYNADITAQIVHRQIAPHALGRDANDCAKLGARILEGEHKFPGSYLCRALGGLDTALWDMRARRAGKPVCELLGGAPGKLRAYASSMRRDITGEQESDRLNRLCEVHGFDAVKFRIGAECGHDNDEWPGRTEDIVKRMAKKMDDKVALMVDANSCYSPQRAIEIGKFLQDHRVSHFEEPCPYWELAQTKTVTDALTIDVSGGEQDCLMREWRRMIDMRAVDIVQPDICYVGGITRALAVAKMAAKRGLPCTPHSANLSMVTLFTMHFLRAQHGQYSDGAANIYLPGKYLEFSIEDESYYPWQADLFVEDPYAVQDGFVTVTDRPGWGVEINPKWLAAAKYQKSEM